MSRRQDASTLEQQNDAQLDELHSKIRALHHVTVDIHNDSRSQNTLLDGTSNAFESIGNSITNSASRLGRNITSQQSQYKTIGYAIAAVAALYFIWKIVL